MKKYYKENFPWNRIYLNTRFFTRLPAYVSASSTVTWTSGWLLYT